MPNRSAYPPDLARYVEAHWPAEHPLAIPVELLDEALSVAFQASFTTEETRPTRFRLLLTPVDKLPASGVPNEGVLRLTFDRSRPLAAGELRRLAPAAPFETSLIGAQVEDDAFRIWGVAHSGPAWLAPSWGGRRLVATWTHDPIIHVSGPGQLAVRCAGRLIGALERGEIVDAMMDVFESRWLREMFAPERERVRAEHAALQAGSSSPTEVEHSLVGRMGQHMLRRMVQLVRGAGHGGLLLVVDGDAASPNLSGLRLKYRLGQDEPSHRYRTLLFRILETVAASSTKASVGWADFAADPSPALEALERAVFEWSRVVANFAAIDGAVVLDRRFGLLGFGAEVSAELPAPSEVWRALDPECQELTRDDIESVGTRHRAAYRFVNDHPGGLALVVSHDGGVSFVAKREGKVVIWEHSISA